MTDGRNDIVLKISKDKAQALGTAFYASKDRIVTCYHVLDPDCKGLNDKYFIKNNSESNWRDASPIRKQCWPRPLDIAILECEPVNKIINLEIWNGKQGKFLSIGYDCTQQIGPFSIKGDIMGITTHDGRNRIQLDTDSGLVNRGFSGSPVWSKDQDKIIGFISWNAGEAGKIEHILAIPIEDILNSDNDRDVDLIADFIKSKFVLLKRSSVKSTLELTKEVPQGDKVLPLMSQMSKIKNMKEQIAFAKEKNFVNIYPKSWAEKESQLIGLYLLLKLSKELDKFEDMYDAGCASSGQLDSLRTLGYLYQKKISDNFKYYAQDFNPLWISKLNIQKEKLIQDPLPLVKEDDKVSLISCIHTLHYLSTNPLAIYCTLFSFNKILKDGGYCYIAVPNKESQPGMLDLLERSATGANFKIIESGKCRLIHELMDEPYNITTFIFLIIKKCGQIEPDYWSELIGACFFRAGCFDIAKRFEIHSERDIKKDFFRLEEDLLDIMKEKDPYHLTFRLALYTIDKGWTESIKEEECKKNIKIKMREINDFMIGEKITIKNTSLHNLCAEYLYWLLKLYLWRARPIYDIKYQYDKIKEHIQSTEDVRIDVESLDNRQIGKLLRHLFELCHYENINLRKPFLDFYDKMKKNKL